MNRKILLPVFVVLLAVAGGMWVAKTQSPAPTPAAAGRKILYYQSAMHPWIKSDKPGKCPICGMNLVPIYEGDTGMDTNMTPGTVRLNASSVSVINVQTGTVTNQPLVRTLHFGGQIMANSSQQAWFEFTVYERDLPWLKIGQTLRVTIPSVPDKSFAAQIKLHGGKSFADEDFDNMTGSIKLRAELSESPVEAGELGSHKYFNGLYAESHLVAETGPVLTVPRSAVISRGSGPVVFLDKGDGHYTPRAVLLGRTGDEFYELLAGLDAGDKVVTNGNLLIDSEAQLAAGL
jgi:Heavy metal binding domain/Barrel-sandwich domain of CusB or HlyD membrane-fusion